MKKFVYMFTEKEETELEEFYEKHRHPKQPLATAGGKFVYSFNPTGVGTFVVIRCLACKKEKDITDIEGW